MDYNFPYFKTNDITVEIIPYDYCYYVKVVYPVRIGLCSYQKQYIHSWYKGKENAYKAAFSYANSVINNPLTRPS